MQALLYGLSIVVIYVSLGCFLLLFDASALNSLSTNAVFNIFLFCCSFFCHFVFGGFELMLPSSWSTAIDAKADKSSGVIGILLMACTLVIVSFSCTGPIIGTLLVSVATKGSLLGPAIGMLGFAIALAVPFTLLPSSRHGCILCRVRAVGSIPSRCCSVSSSWLFLSSFSVSPIRLMVGICLAVQRLPPFGLLFLLLLGYICWVNFVCPTMMRGLWCPFPVSFCLWHRSRLPYI